MSPICGVYRITNGTNGKTYIGSSVDVSKRFVQHRNRTNSGSLSRDIERLGAHEFFFEIVEICQVARLGEREAFHIERESPQYNLSRQRWHSKLLNRTRR